MPMDYKNKIYLTLVSSFLLLVFALYVSYENIQSNNDVIRYLEKDQIKLNYYANKLNYDIKKNQTDLLQLILLKKDFSNTINYNSFENIQTSVDHLELFFHNKKTDLEGFQRTLETIQKRTIAYKAVQNSLLEALKEKDEIDIEDALIGFNAITVNFSQDTQKLIDISNEALYTKIVQLKLNNNQSATTIILSFLIAILMIGFTSYKFFRLHTKLRAQLQRAENAEKEQKNLQKQLLSYNEDLEKEVAKKAKEIRQKIYSNFLTGLANRNRLLEDATLYSFSMIAIINIDKFQSFNDVYGEEIGNVAIKLTAEFLQEELKGEPIILYHVGGDEFALVVHKEDSLTQEEFKNIIADILHNYQRKEFEYEDKKFSFIMSAGISYTGRRKMLAYADMALKDAKKRNIQLSEFNDDKELERIHQSDIECHNKLLTALQNDKLISYFQPIVPIQNKSKPIKYESLIRLMDEDGKIIAPFNFIRVAKRNRIYYRITNTVLRNTLDAVTQYNVPCSINISLSDIENDRTMKTFFDLIDTYEHNELLTVELLETEDFENYQLVYDFCVKVRSYGLKIALDDFGSGYSNFSHILNLPIDYIKIDATLISNIDRDQNSKIMVETIVDLAKKLHIATIAEFVSSHEILEVITELGVDYAQGFYMGKPEPIQRHIREGQKES
jgi:diguanylate cyclase (GGDEF)-like protein